MWIVLTLVLVGAALLLLETILPGLVAGILGVVCLISAVFLGYASFGLRIGHAILFGTALGVVLGTIIWIKYFPQSRLAHLFISRKIAGEVKPEKEELVGRSGFAQTNLRPSGAALIDGQRVDVVTEGNMIEQGASLKVIAVEGMRVVVRALDGAPNRKD